LTEISALHLGGKPDVNMKCEKVTSRRNLHEGLTNGVNAVREMLLGLDFAIIIFIETLSNGILNVID
jgi:hypothetical protein